MGGKRLSSILSKSPSDVVIVTSLRTPICRSYKGALRDAYPEELLSTVLRATLTAVPELDAQLVDDVGVGVVLSELGGSKVGRMALLHAGFPVTTSLFTTNRACGSSLQSLAQVAAGIRVGDVRVGIAAGMESMTRNYGSKAVPRDVWPALLGSAGDCVMPMGVTAENVARRYGVGRKEQDEFAARSQQRAWAARRAGRFLDEITPVRTIRRLEDGGEEGVLVSEDDGVREGVTPETLASLKPAFEEGGTCTAGNSSQISDGAAATLLMSRGTADSLGLSRRILGKFVAAGTAGCAPDEMGVGPAVIIPKLLGRLGLEKSDVDRWEINEAFAAQAVYCVRELGLDEARVNPDGGAIALGHPLGATGGRMVSTLMHGMRRAGERVGLVSMCVGTGMGMAGVFVSEA